MLPKEEWLPQAQAVPPGKRARVDHLCGPGRTLLVRNIDDATFTARCFRCGDGGTHTERRSLAQLAAASQRLREADAVCQGLWRQPEPPVHDMDHWPPAARLWLYRAGVGKTEALAMGAYYHAQTDRVVLPVSDAREVHLGSGDGALYYQARAYQPGRMPKYLGPAHRPPSLIAGYRPEHPASAVPTLTEDLLSSFKVSLAGYVGWAVMGTSVPSAYIAELLQTTRACNVWLDPDAAGQKAANKYIKQLRAYGVAVRNIVSQRDPKLHFISEIQEILQ